MNEKTFNRANLKEQKTLRQSLRNHGTSAEAVLWLRLKGKQVYKLKFRRQYGFGPYVMDFYCPELRLAIELDGDIHQSYEVNQYDQKRTNYLRANKINVLRYENKVVFEKLECIVDDIIRYQKEYKGQFQTTPAPPNSGGDGLTDIRKTKV